MNLKKVRDIDALIKHAAEIEYIKRDVERYIDKIIEQIIKIERNYFNELKQQEIGEIEGISVVLVDGDVVEKNIDMDFVEGNNDVSNKTDKVRYMPSETIWIDGNLDSKTFKYIMLHEYLERKLINEFKLDYEEAHDIANYFESQFREMMES